MMMPFFHQERLLQTTTTTTTTTTNNSSTTNILYDDDEEEYISTGLSISELVLAIGLFFLMVGVGVSCKIELLQKMVQSRRALQAAAVGVTCQFVLMPTIAYVFTLIFQIKGYTALGYILAGSMPGGSSSNIFTLWSEGVLELSVFMTILSTLLAFGMTPLWIYIFIEAVDGIDSAEIAFDQIAISFAFLIIPLSIGMSLNFVKCKDTIHHIVERLLNISAFIFFAAAIVVMLVENPDALKDYGTWKIYLSAILYFPIATSIAYGITTLLKFPPSVRRTVVMETGFQNLVLALAIGEKIVTTQNQANQAIPFPLMYATLMYVWAAILIPLCRWQKRRNEEKGIVDCDTEFIITIHKEDENNNDEKDEAQQIEAVVLSPEKIMETQDTSTPLPPEHTA